MKNILPLWTTGAITTSSTTAQAMALPNGSGKSTFTQYFEKIGEYTTADDVVAVTGMDNAEAARWVDEKRYEAIDNQKDFTLFLSFPMSYGAKY
ncbi:MAG: hypothetical protein IJT01_04450 [Selenomonadaceae bacterium]|nr:hypothetical protein [Selenomonadaceae bacterium]